MKADASMRILASEAEAFADPRRVGREDHFGKDPLAGTKKPGRELAPGRVDFLSTG